MLADLGESDGSPPAEILGDYLAPPLGKRVLRRESMGLITQAVDLGDCRAAYVTATGWSAAEVDAFVATIGCQGER